MSEILVNKARTLTTQLKDALSWVSNSADPNISKNYRLQKNLRRSVFQSKKLEVAAGSKMCVGVYGASQAGKSYLVSVLARQGALPLTAVFGGKEVDFIRHINPDGGKESTGLVTRFTTDQIHAPENYPIKAKFLSEIDLIKIFVNSFSHDLLPDEQEDFDSHVDRISKVLANLDDYQKTISPITIEDVYDLEEYCNSRLVSNVQLQALKKVDFWERAAELLPRLGEDGRVKLVELLWEEIPSLTRTYRLLIAELKRLGFPEFVYCSPDALFDSQSGDWSRSNQSIINVSTLDGLGSTDALSVGLLTSNNIPANISISTLCALIAELIIPLRDKPHNFFEFTDLLDFPGARSRSPRPKINEILSPINVQIENFLRGKVAYLFDKYSTDLELSSMLLCVGPSNLEVVGLAPLVEDWIEKTHGKSPEERENMPAALFLILTKFDQEFSQGGGKSSDGTRWTTRLEASLLKPFGAHSPRTNWVTRWDTKGPFNNTYWLRNPNVDQFGLMQYAGDIGNSPEIGLAPERLSHVASLRQDFVSNAVVQKHFKSPSDAWDAGMQLNDGGIDYLVTGLQRVCRPEVKHRQVDALLDAIASARDAELRKFYVNSDLTHVAEEKRQLAETILRTGASLFKIRRLGEFINFILVSDLMTQDIFRRVENQYEREKNLSRHPQNETRKIVSKIDDDLATLLGLSVASADESPEPKDEIESGDFTDRLVMNFLSEWTSSILSKLSEGNAEAYLHFDRDLLSRLLHELERAAKRTGLVAHLKNTMQISYQYKSSNSKSWMLQQTSTLTSLFNHFLVHGGCCVNSSAGAQHIDTIDGKRISVFAPRNEADQIEISEIAEDFSKSYFIDWLQAIQYTVRANADYLAQEAGDTPSNRALGDIVTKLSALYKR